MVVTARTRLVNPRLGTYFAIFAAAFTALVLMALMLEQLDVADVILRAAMFAVPLALYAGIGVCAPAWEPGDFFACGRRVPAFFNGLVLGVAALGGAGFLAFTGAMLMSGFDGLCLGIGVYAGLVFMAVLFAPYLRKFGAYTLPSYLGRRFANGTLRIVAAAVLSAPVLLLLIAEVRFAAYAGARLTGWPESLAAVVAVAAVAGILSAGGMRAMTWSSSAKAIAAVLALAVPATIVAVMLFNLPLPQMTQGNILRIIARIEITRGVPIVIAPPLAFDLPGTELGEIPKRYLQAFGSVGSLGFMFMMFLTAAGISASPVLLPRAGTTPGVYEARKSLGWAVLVAGIVVLTLSADAVFLRSILVGQVLHQPADQLPSWFRELEAVGAAQITPGTDVVALNNIMFQRDAALFALPVAAGLPQVLVYLALAGALAATLAALAAALMAISAMLAEDVVHGLADDVAGSRARVTVARLAVPGAALVALWLAFAIPADPLQLFLWAVTLSAAASFPVLFLSIWWKRLNAWGAMAALCTGLGVTAFVALLSETGAISLPSALAGVVGLPCAFLAAGIVTHLTPAPAANLLELAMDLRVPGGETLYDREVRLQRLKGRAPV
jgi:cation/acetate symporter